jgi:precorrin-4/cobalt-precorrin-4 C11-methyltransferase
VPEAEGLAALAQHRASMVIFLSVGMMERVVDELKTGYPDDTPVVVIEKASWPEQKIVRGNLNDIAARVKEAAIHKTALIYVGESLKASETALGKESRLYHRDFSHGYRK